MRKILSKLIASIICIGVIAWLVIGSVQARFSDIESTQNNNFTAGILDLKTNDTDGVTQTLYLIGFIPGESSGTQTITLKNNGNLNGSSLDISLTYLQDDGTNPPGATGTRTADEVASEIIVTTLTYDGSDLLGSVADSNSNGYKDIYDIAAANLSGQSGISTGATKDFVIAVQLQSGLGTAYEADGIVVTMNFTINL